MLTSRPPQVGLSANTNYGNHFATRQAEGESVMKTKQPENKPVKICPSFETLKAMRNIQVTPWKQPVNGQISGTINLKINY